MVLTAGLVLLWLAAMVIVRRIFRAIAEAEEDRELEAWLAELEWLRNDD